jgi:methyl-accepting chemotaxis protein
LLETIAQRDVDEPDKPYVQAAPAAAGATPLDDVLRNYSIGEAGIFQRNCRPFAAAELAHHNTRILMSANRVLQQVHEEALKMSGRNGWPLPVQTCRGDMGGGDFIVTTTVAVPIVVDGRHWGGQRLAYRF